MCVVAGLAGAFRHGSHHTALTGCPGIASEKKLWVVHCTADAGGLCRESGWHAPGIIPFCHRALHSFLSFFLICFWRQLLSLVRPLIEWFKLASQILTNDIYKSVEHRVVVNAERSRHSVAVFYDPAKTKLINPASPLVDEDRPALFPSILFGEHVATWYSKGPDGKKNIDSLVIEWCTCYPYNWSGASLLSWRDRALALASPNFAKENVFLLVLLFML